MKKLFTLLSILLMFAASSFAKRLPPPEVAMLTKENLVYRSAVNVSDNGKWFFGIVVIESAEEPKNSRSVPIYAIEMDKYLEKDVQWKFIKSMEFRDENTITIINERNHTFELNINTLEVKCVNVKNNVFRCNFRAKERYKCISGDINKIFKMVINTENSKAESK
ncbi:MAG TPA: hypothetical protein DCZ76_13680 [Treponema sp.]|nr:hypothetical protein [Treponema sp.]